MEKMHVFAGRLAERISVLPSTRRAAIVDELLRETASILETDVEPHWSRAPELASRLKTAPDNVEVLEAMAREVATDGRDVSTGITTLLSALRMLGALGKDSAEATRALVLALLSLSVLVGRADEAGYMAIPQDEVWAAHPFVARVRMFLDTTIP